MELPLAASVSPRAGATRSGRHRTAGHAARGARARRRLDHEPEATLLHAGIAAALCVVWVFIESEWMPAAITVVMILLTFATFSKRSEVPVWRYDDRLLTPGVLDPQRRYLAMYDFDSTLAEDPRGRPSRGIRVEMRPGNTPMLSGLKFINGYSPLGLAALRNVFDVDVHGPMNPERAEVFLRYEIGPNELLHQLGVDGLIVPEPMARRHAPALSRNGWVPAARVGSSLVLHRERIVSPVFRAAVAVRIGDEQRAYSAIFNRRTPQLPVVLFTPGDGRPEMYGRRDLRIVEEGRNHTRVVYEDKGGKSLLVFRRPWLPGWRATVDGERVPVLRANMILPAVEVPADGFDVRLHYRPTSLIVGLAIAAVSFAALVVVSLRAAKT
jgi:hypothetical protein